jgi:hypothetical protein
MGKVCHQCGKEYEKIGNHWVQSSSCNHKKLTEKEHQIITGTLMGDGTIYRESKNPYLQVVMISPNYLNCVANKFGILGGEVTLKETAAKSAQKAKESGFDLNAKEENYSDTYEWRSVCHPELHEFANWYASGEKVWPEDIQLTPTVLKHWYCGDGYWGNTSGKNRISIGMSNEVDKTEKVDKMFERANIPSPNTYNITNTKNGSKSCDALFTVSQSKELWEYMGEPLPDFEYKWPEEYHRNC